MNIEIYEYRDSSEFIENVAIQVENGNCVIIKAKTDNENRLNKMGLGLSKKVLEEAERYYRINDKMNHIATRGIVKKIIDVSLKRETEWSDWLIGSNGKPYIQSSKIRFNVSHTRGCALVSFSLQEVGVDVELVDLKFQYKSILSDVFLAKEIRDVGNDVTKFYKYWVSKESRLKQTGLGVTKLKEVEIIDDRGETIILFDHTFREIKPIMFFTPYKGYVACVSCL